MKYRNFSENIFRVKVNTSSNLNVKIQKTLGIWVYDRNNNDALIVKIKGRNFVGVVRFELTTS